MWLYICTIKYYIFINTCLISCYDGVTSRYDGVISRYDSVISRYGCVTSRYGGVSKGLKTEGLAQRLKDWQISHFARVSKSQNRYGLKSKVLTDFHFQV